MAHNLTCLKSANPSIPTVQDILVLWLRPLAYDEQRVRRKPDEEDCMSRAVSIAMAFGLDDAPHRALRAGMCNPQSEAYRGVPQQTLLVGIVREQNWLAVVHARTLFLLASGMSVVGSSPGAT